MSEKNEDLVSAIVDLREADVARMVDELLASGTDPLDVVAAGKQAMDVVGKQFADGELFIPELIMAGEIMKAISTKVEPRLAGQRSTKRLGTVVLGTVQGDIHDIAVSRKVEDNTIQHERHILRSTVRRVYRCSHSTMAVVPTRMAVVPTRNFASTAIQGGIE